MPIIREPESRLLQAVYFGHTSRVEELLEQPTLDVNTRNPERNTPLMKALSSGHRLIVKLLLGHPRVDVNLANKFGWTALHFACNSKQDELVDLLLRSPRININLCDGLGASALNRACSVGNLGAVRFMVARRGGSILAGDVMKSLRTASKYPELISVLRAVQEDREQARVDCQRNLGLTDSFAAELFALTVLLCDGYLQPKWRQDSKNPEDERRLRFFQIIRSLHLDLQAVLCYRLYGSSKDILPARQRDLAFTEVAMALKRETPKVLPASAKN